ncbi:hypothetical protein P152DRAFT_461078 [Eremomyces bilateralis CBS 781.70]|uniref:DUF7136 domain-containing protein n=1 Tax=Eremomyces bilateralis CBS 781.70 TaxID=1392243 RepID=A0A6G1FWJ3_9PEZI|nr:uncharacterized protein P152DRAFT_461078 [Eremomyces bilateralis CBS 781.70]KAF1809999.1 hypothetical protein P152DRAFT_461078 [Eremomyces bilateralis CBS 781.70]
MKSLFFSAALLVTVALAQDMVTFPTDIEVDIVLPRPNTTYLYQSPFPLIFAIQNAKVAWDFGFTFSWELHNDIGLKDFGRAGAGGPSLANPSPPPSDPFIIVNSTRIDGNWRDPVTTWTLAWELKLATNCTDEGNRFRISAGYVFGEGRSNFTTTGSGIPPAIQGGGECPIAAGVFGIEANLTGCPHFGDAVGGPANPCAVALDDVRISSISAQLPTPTKVGISTTGETTSATQSVVTTGTPDGPPATGSAAITGAYLWRDSFFLPIVLFGVIGTAMLML